MRAGGGLLAQFPAPLGWFGLVWLVSVLLVGGGLRGRGELRECWVAGVGRLRCRVGEVGGRVRPGGGLLAQFPAPLGWFGLVWLVSVLLVGGGLRGRGELRECWVAGVGRLRCRAGKAGGRVRAGR
ncbi:hypothetical protein GCM10022227_47060 [Streptomyces sedi]